MAAEVGIVFSNPHGVFFPGQMVSGYAVVHVRVKPLSTEYLKLTFDGRAYTHWTVQESHTHTNSDGTTRTDYESITYSAYVIYTHGEAILWRGNSLDIGTHQFPFQFNLPLNCAPSFEGCYGHIRYMTKACLHRPTLRFNIDQKKMFTVAPPFDLNSIPQAISPVANSASKKVGMVLMKHGRVTFQCRIAKMGFVPGENVVVDISVDNGSSRPVIRASASLHQMARFIGFRSSRAFECHESFTHGNCRFMDEKREQCRKVATGEQKICIPKNSKGDVQLYINVPPTVSSFNNCPIIAVDYYVKVKIETEGSVGNKLSCESPVLIGTIPLRMITVAVVQTYPSAPPAPGFNVPPYPASNAPSTSTVPPYPASNTPSTSTVPPYPNSSLNAPGVSNGVQPPPYPTAPAADGQPQPNIAPPSYEESVFGGGGILPGMGEESSGTNATENFAPRYPYYSNLGVLPQSTQSQQTQAPPIPVKK